MDCAVIYHSPPTFAAKTAAIGDTMQRESRRFGQPNFTAIGPDDLFRLFHLYDEQCFDGWLARTVMEKTQTPLSFRLSSTMTRAGGKTIRTRITQPTGEMKVSYEIAIASRLLFMTFGDIDRPVVVCGLPCAHRLDALQRIMEHEMIHLYELLKWGRSSCSAKRFQNIASGMFGHTRHTHDLVTPRERAAVKHGIRVGDFVRFDFQGTTQVGQINRIHHRATVLVEAIDGIRYSNGKRYKKYYVPLAELQLVRRRPSTTIAHSGKREIAAGSGISEMARIC